MMLLQNSNFRKILILLLLLLYFGISMSFSNTGKKVVLTFDDGPHPGTTERILEILKEHKVPATFFLVGVMIKKHPYLVRKIYESGSEIGNHTYSDIRLTRLNKNDVAKSLCSVDNLLEGITGERSIYFRPPGGRLNDNVSDVAHNLGYQTVLWTRHVNDTALGITKERIIRRATSNADNTELIMMHDGPPETIEALPEIIKFYKDKGYEFASISEDTPPMFKNIANKNKPQLFSYKIKKFNKFISESDETREEIPIGVLGFLTICASVGSSVFIFRGGIGKNKNSHVSVVLLNTKKEYIDKLLGILKAHNIKGTFFISKKNAKEFLDRNVEDIHNHNIAYYEDDSAIMLKKDLREWKEKMKRYEFSIVPLYYSPVKYSIRDIEKARDAGFLPVDWKMLPPKKSAGNNNDVVEHVVKRLKRRSVIPMWGDCEKTIEALPELIKRISDKGYQFLSLSDYLVRRSN